MCPESLGVPTLLPSGVGFDQPNVLFGTDFPDIFKRAAIGDEGLDLGDMADAHRRGSFELRRVGNEDDMARIGDDRLGDFHFSEIEIK